MKREIIFKRSTDISECTLEKTEYCHVFVDGKSVSYLYKEEDMIEWGADCDLEADAYENLHGQTLTEAKKAVKDHYNSI